MAHTQQANPFGNGKGGDGPMKDGGNDFTKNPSPQPAPGGVGNDFTKNPGGFDGGNATSTTVGPDPASVPGGGRMPFAPKPAFGGGMKPTPHFKLKG